VGACGYDVCGGIPKSDQTFPDGALQELFIKFILATASPLRTGQTATPSLKVLPSTCIVRLVGVVAEAAHKAYSPVQILIEGCAYTDVQNSKEIKNLFIIVSP